MRSRRECFANCWVAAAGIVATRRCSRLAIPPSGWQGVLEALLHFPVTSLLFIRLECTVHHKSTRNTPSSRAISRLGAAAWCLGACTHRALRMFSA